VLLLVGGGHAHVAVLADLARRGVPEGARVVLLTPERSLRYSGMVPGWLAGQHGQGEGLVDLAALAARAGVAFVPGRCVAFDPEARVVRTDAGAAIAFDLASFDTGGEGQAAALLGENPRLVDVRPIGAFVERLAALRASRREWGHVMVAGGGAGGVELAFGLRNLAGVPARPQVTLATGQAGLLPGFAPAVRRRVARALERQGIAAIPVDVRFASGALVADSSADPFASSEVEKPVATAGVAPRSAGTGKSVFQSLEPADLVVAALGSAAPGWVRASGIATDAAGFLLVDAQQRSVSHPHIFAAGDVAARADRRLAHSGVHAVFAGPVLAANLRSVLAGEAPRATYRPRRHSLYLLNTGDGSAIASFGPLCAEGPWVLALKHRIDKGWIAKYARLTGASGDQD